MTGDLHDALRGADVFIGVSAPGVLPAEWIADMAPIPVVFALANPDPEVDVDAAQQLAAIVATGRSDYPNQINNVLAFPGVFRGLLDARAREVTHRDAAAGRRRRWRTASATSSSTPPTSCPVVFDPEVPKCGGRRSARRGRCVGLIG